MVEAKYNFEEYKIKRYEEFKKDCMDIMFSSFKLSFFVFDLNEKILYMSEYLEKRFNIKLYPGLTLDEVLGFALDESVIASFFDLLTVVTTKNEHIFNELPIKTSNGYKWYKVELSFDRENQLIKGMFTSSGPQKSRDFFIQKDKKEIVEMIELLPHPVFLFDDNELIYTNFENEHIVNTIHRLLQRSIGEVFIDVSNVSEIVELERVKRIDDLEEYSLVQRVNNVIEFYYVRVTRKNEFTLYTYLKKETKERNTYLQKVLQANELVIEIRDLVDNTDNLRYVFEFLLSKISTVITSSTRGCLLRIDDDLNMYMDLFHGYDDEYVNVFRIPFRKSFSYLHLQNDYSKSVIVNDVQKRYAKLFPDIKPEKGKVAIQSNISTPLVVNNNLYGIISVDSDENNVFDQVDLYLLDFIKVQLERAIEKQEKLQEIRRKSMLDGLTGLMNRREMMKMFDIFMKQAKEHEESFLFAIFDLDHLKETNDTYGHNCGDKIIKQFAFTLKDNTRNEDVIARIGGDEFVGLFRGIGKDRLIERINEWQHKLSLSPVIYKNNEVYTEFSFGVVEYPSDGIIYEEVLEKADKILYEQKRIKKSKC